MKFACINDIAPADDLAGQCARIAQAGCAGLETIVFPDTDLDAWGRHTQHTARDAGLSVAAVIIGGLALHRQAQAGYIERALQAIAMLPEAIAVVTPQYEAQSPLPLHPPYPAPPEDEMKRVREAMLDIDAIAATTGVCVCIEPITQFESQFCRDVTGALKLIEASPHLKLCLDFHNMNITEADIAASIRTAQGRIGHVHVADNNRRMPGEGHIDFSPGLAALKQMDYGGWYSFECSTEHEFVAGVSRSIGYLKGKA